MNRRHIALICTVALAASCSPSSKPPAQRNACDLLPKQLAEQVLSVKVSETISQHFGQNPRQAVISNCQYVAELAAPIGSVTFTIREGGQPEEWSAPMDDFVRTMKRTFGERYELKKLNGLGDGAVWDSSLKQLTVFAHSNIYAWTAPGSTDPNIEIALTTLAHKTLENA